MPVHEKVMLTITLLIFPVSFAAVNGHYFICGKHGLYPITVFSRGCRAIRRAVRSLPATAVIRAPRSDKDPIQVVMYDPDSDQDRSRPAEEALGHSMPGQYYELLRYKGTVSVIECELLMTRRLWRDVGRLLAGLAVILPVAGLGTWLFLDAFEVIDTLPW